MSNMVYLRNNNDLLAGPIIDAKEDGGILRISYANPEFYFQGTLDLILSAGKQSSYGTFGLTLPDSEINEMSIIGEVKHLPGLITYSGIGTAPTAPTARAK
ncbi:hypothetical protein GPY61_30035 [Massilia sp. NEAU-DD11]|uniref:Uncharacterized protein n=1 Tax=Massilia cellulosiltytica TaxID=2683234 RepID=A0A7X3G5U5_9BURK|nr:hypothetical protein [Telluria cellulosilytica]MVW64178.1 hypothetical protein [Telluria cellulosilytica]